MKILVCGARDYSDYEKIYNYLKKKYENGDIIIVEGGAPGADYLSKRAAVSLNIEYREYKADWDIRSFLQYLL